MRPRLGDTERGAKPTMPKRITVTLADTVAAKLQRWSDARGQEIATVAGVAIELAVNADEDKGEIPQPPKTSEGEQS